ncbi:Ubiquitin carboxyl-terminal hydrolase 10 [Oopsacas minuta]|uniref:ubiquitinyl hydrolase 1 n=1 Tax=Oopsacas minuta TaxID=111878 RepID=A0AAV7JQG0_9METZ|nr:Ubiquitin carboxyl-terminal hydrolase 10 [Oopsacas minuta]
MTDQNGHAANLLEFCQFGNFRPDESLKLISQTPSVKFRIEKGNCSYIYFNNPLFIHMRKSSQESAKNTADNFGNTVVQISNKTPICQSDYSHEILPLPIISTSRQPLIHQSQTMTLGRQEKAVNNIEIIRENSHIPNENTKSRSSHTSKNGITSPKIQEPKTDNKCTKIWSSLFDNQTTITPKKGKQNSNGDTQTNSIDRIDAIDKGQRLYTFLTTNLVAKESPQPRGLINRGNLCYVHAALQALCSCSEFSTLIQSFEPFPSLSTKPSATPVFDSLILFLHDYATIKIPVFVTSGKTRKAPQIKPIPTPIEPIYIYNMIKKLQPQNLSLRRQEDSEEFLGFILQKLHEEMSFVIEIYKKDANIQSQIYEIETAITDDEWLEVGKRNKTASTRRNFINNSPISQIFCGEIRSSIHLSKSKDSVTHQPFFSLQLDMQQVDVTTIQQAISGLLKPEEVAGFIDANSNETTVHRKQNLSKLPAVLILHMKRFNFVADTCYKVSKQIDYPAKLTLPLSLLSHEFRDKGPVTYKLIAVVYHHGESATGGHYTSAIFCDSSHQWILTDDREIHPITEDFVLKHQAKRTAYLLFYRQIV